MSPTPDRLLSIQEVVEMVGLSRATIYNMVKRKNFHPSTGRDYGQRAGGCRMCRSGSPH